MSTVFWHGAQFPKPFKVLHASWLYKRAFQKSHGVHTQSLQSDKPYCVQIRTVRYYQHLVCYDSAVIKKSVCVCSPYRWMSAGSGEAVACNTWREVVSSMEIFNRSIPEFRFIHRVFCAVLRTFTIIPVKHTTAGAQEEYYIVFFAVFCTSSWNILYLWSWDIYLHALQKL